MICPARAGPSDLGPSGPRDLELYSMSELGPSVPLSVLEEQQIAADVPLCSTQPERARPIHVRPTYGRPARQILISPARPI